ncbi:MAG TPA: hypothetical protein VFM54_11085 [Micromonosporaceae bacterium]|nr:hypothetical protein [Micromonosporaceae bacterium]
MVPAPATGQRELRGRRVVVGLPGVGWRADLRGDDPVVQGSRTYVPVLAEHEWYRAEAEQIEVFAPLVPIERVWVETLEEPAPDRAGPVPPPRPPASLDAPVRRDAVPVRDAHPVTGLRVVRLTEQGEQRDLRAVTEEYVGADGDSYVRVANELDWYRWAWSGQFPRTMEVPVGSLWAE